MLSTIQSISSNIKIRTKMVLLVCSVVFVSVLPLSVIVLYRNQSVVLDKTFEVCRNLANNIANLATEELLINETYDATRTSISRLPESKISGLVGTYVLNIDGVNVADLQDEKVGTSPEYEKLSYYNSLTELTLSEIAFQGKSLLEFVYPIFIDYQSSKMRVGTAVFTFDRDVVYEPVMEIRRTIIVVSSVLFGLGIVIALFAAFSLAKPIQILSEGARQIGGGDLNYRIPITGRDEIGQLASTFNQMTHKIQDFTNNLESMVVQRTDELNKTLQEVQALKEAQDGDYYLTSLLLEPLQFNNNNTKNVQTEFYVEQKKKFQFRKWNSQIGGDICITDTIKLNGREYTVFMNGDAMGKSIQGAGGALVFGVVFNSGIMRTRREKNSRVHPEIWLKERFLDLQNVFITFEGSMYISVCMGLVDEVTGLMYYINAEHPWTVLYRDGKASFLEQELTLRKLGTPGQEDKLAVRMFQLMPGDVIFVGSDGRDDILIPQENGNSIMNEDENKYLEKVELGGGDLNRIVDIIKNEGTVTDDLSILRLAFKEGREEEEIITIPYEVEEAIQEGFELVQVGKEAEALQRIDSLIHSENSYPELLKLLGNIYFNRKDYLKALDCFLSYSELNPGDNEYIYAISNTYRLIGQLNEAADFGERLYLRDKDHYLNLINLATIYKEMGIESRSNYMAEKAILIDPKARGVLNIQDSFPQVKAQANPIISYEENVSEKVLDSSQGTIIKEKSLDEIIDEADRFYQAKQYRESMEMYLKYQEEDSKNPWVLFRLGNCFSLLNDLESAIDYYLKSIQLAPKNHHAHNNLGSIYFRLKHYTKAKNSWIKALELKPDFQKAQINLSRLEKYEQNRLTESQKVGS
jgi:tetratricopeptide (TPR) repeat protein/HAMP domain-containing protein